MFNNWSLCCISKTLSESGVNFKSMTYTNFCKMPRTEALRELCTRILHNVKTAHRTIQFCQQRGISAYRLSSNLFPIISHSEVRMKISDLPNYSDIVLECDRIKQTLQQKPIRISSHPSEYITLSSEDSHTVENSIRDLEQHAELFDLLGLPKDYNSPFNIHIRKEGNVSDIISRVMKNYDKLCDSVRQRLVFENNDNQNGSWSIRSLVKNISDKYGIPTTFDYLHHAILPDGMTEEDAFLLAYDTWQSYTPLFHYSEGVAKDGVVTRKHKDSPDSFPIVYNPNVYLDVELKDKCQAIFKLQKNETH
jgi:UV DNA damage endonuclease